MYKRRLFSVFMENYKIGVDPLFLKDYIVIIIISKFYIAQASTNKVVKALSIYKLSSKCTFPLKLHGSHLLAQRDVLVSP